MRRVGVLLVAFVSAVAALAQAPLDDTRLLVEAQTQFGVLKPVSPEAIGPAAELGRAVFWDPRLSADGKTACASCHHAADWGADRRPFSPDARGRLTSRNSQTVFNAMLQPALRWTGDRKSGAHQAERSLTGSMGFTNVTAVLPLLRQHGYEPRFRQTWPDDPVPLTVTNYARALEAYQATLVTPAPFDRFLAGDAAALSDRQKEGLRVFLRVGCSDCHSGPLLGGKGLRKFGLKRPYWEATKSARRDTGLHEATKLDEDREKFRVSMLRNIAKTAPYFHDGSVLGLKEAVEVMAEVQLGQRLGENDLEDVTAFLDSLTGKVPEHFGSN